MKSKSLKYVESLITNKTTKEELDLIDFIKKCIRNYKEKEIIENKVNLEHYFDSLWGLYPRKVNKELAKKTFEHKMRGLTEEETRDKANKVYILQSQYVNKCKELGTEIQFISHYSSWLNANIPNSKFYRGK